MYISSQYFLSLVDAWESMGLPREQTCSLITDNVNELKNPRYRIPLDGLQLVLDFAAQELELPNIGIETAYKYRAMAIGDMRSVFGHCDSLAGAAEFYSKYAVLAETIGSPALRRRRDGTFVIWAEAYTDHNKYRQITELILGGYVITTNWLAWCFENRIKSVSFRHDEPSNLNRFREICLCPVQFGQSENSLELYPENVDKPLPASNPRKLAAIEAALSNFVASAKRQSRLEIEVFAAIKKAINMGELSTSEIARTLNMSERTFRRRLRARGLSYRSLVDNVRQTMCKNEMQKGKTFTEIAHDLGYNDQSAFTRAFKKWYGTTPSQFEEIKFTI